MKTRPTSSLFTPIGMGCILVLTSVTVPAEIILDEPFNYETGNLVGAFPLPGLTGGGFGFSGPWSGRGTVVNPGQSHPTITSSGNGFSSVSEQPAYRQFTAPIVVNPVSPRTVFIRYITSAASAVPPDYAGFSFFSGPNGSGRVEELFLGKPWMAPNYGLEVTGAGGPQASAVPVNQAETFLVFRVTFTSGADTIDMFVNPGNPLPASPAFTKIAPAGAFQNFTHIRLASGNNGQSFDVDQVRVSDTYAEAVSTVDLTADSDLDGMPDAWEALYPNPNGLVIGINDAAGYLDGDGLTNLEEYTNFTNPKLADTDSDFSNDSTEISLGTDPVNPDTDGDGLLDGRETNTGTFVSATNTGSNPLSADTDGDGMPDGLEVTRGTNPVDLTSVPPPGDLTTTGRDSFDYPDGPLAGKSGGFGFDFDSQSAVNGPFVGHTTRVAPWEDQGGNPSVILGGQLVTENGGALRKFHGVDTFFGGESAGRVNADLSNLNVVYLRADMTRGNDTTTSGISTFDQGVERIYAGVLSEVSPVSGNREFSFGGAGIPSVYTGIQPVAGQKYTLVLKVDYAADLISFFVNPLLTGPEPAPLATAPLTPLSNFWTTAVRVYSDGLTTWDNVIVGREWGALAAFPGAGGQLNGYASWIAGFPEVGSMTAFNEDPDRDGISNGLENGFGTNPSLPSGGLRTVTTAGNQITFNHDQAQNRAVAFSYQWSPNLTNWYGSGVGDPGGTLVTITPQITGPAAAPQVDQVLVTATPSGTPTGRMFLRAEATLVNP